MAPVESSFCVYQVISDPHLTRDHALMGFEFRSGPYPSMKLAVKAVASLQGNELESSNSFVITAYKGESWSYHFESYS